jgi:hypothetical protein
MADSDEQPGDNRQYLRGGTGMPATPRTWPSSSFETGTGEDHPEAVDPVTMQPSEVLNEQLGGTGKARGQTALQSGAVQSKATE